MSVASAQPQTEQNRSPGGSPSSPSAVDREEELRFATEDPADEIAEAPYSNASAFGLEDLLRMIVILLVVIGAIYGVLALLRRNSRPADLESTVIRVLASQSLSVNKTLHAVQVGSTVYLLGASEGSLNVISTITDQETIDTLVLEKSRRTPVKTGGFGAYVGRWLGMNGERERSGSSEPGRHDQLAGRTGGMTGAAATASFLKLQRDRLRELR